MVKRISALKKRIEQVPRNERGRRRYGRALRAEICEAVQRRRSAGETYAAIAADLGIAKSLLAGWMRDYARGAPVREVVVTTEAAPAGANGGKKLSLRLPGGAVVEGLSVEDVAELLRAAK